MNDTILLVDDESDLLQFVSEVLGEIYTVLTACNGRQALELLNTFPVQIIISDVMMPEIDGFELCAEIKSNVRLCHIPVILLTAKNTITAKIEGLKHGADAYIEKPFSHDLLLVQVANLLNNRIRVRDHVVQDPLSHINFSEHSSSDAQFLIKLNDYILTNLSKADFNIDDLARHMNMSRPTLYRRIKSNLNVPIKDVVTQARLRKAVELMAENNHKIFEIAKFVGYRSQTVFGKTFQRYFHQTPLEYINALRSKFKQTDH